MLDVEIKQLLKLKQEYKELTGQDLAGGGGKRGKKGGGGDAANKGDGGKAADGRKKPADANRAKQEQNQAASGREVKKVTRYVARFDCASYVGGLLVRGAVTEVVTIIVALDNVAKTCIVDVGTPWLPSHMSSLITWVSGVDHIVAFP